MASTRMCYQFATSGTCSYGDRCKYNHGVNLYTDTSHRGRLAHNQLKQADRRSKDSYIDEFFAQHQFPYDSSQPLMDEFYRMCSSFRWEREEKGRAREGLKDAMVQQFNSLYGSDAGDISSWHKLCQVLEISPIPEGLGACREAVKKTHVNLVDLLETPNTGKPVEVFGSEKELSEYTIDTQKYFPRNNVYAGGVLEFLLRHIMSPREVVPKKTGGRGGKRKRGRRNI